MPQVSNIIVYRSDILVASLEIPLINDAAQLLTFCSICIFHALLYTVSTVNRPEVAISRDVEDPLLVGSSLMLTCSVSTMGEVGEVIARWLRGDRGEEISSVVLHSEDDDPYELELNFEALSLEDSGIYTCGARLSSNQLATGSQTININVIGTQS